VVAAGIVADHAAQGGPAVRGRVRREHQPVSRCVCLQLVEDGAGLHGRGAPDRVDGQT
jgi:hypothetical protein